MKKLDAVVINFKADILEYASFSFGTPEAGYAYFFYLNGAPGSIKPCTGETTQRKGSSSKPIFDTDVCTEADFWALGIR